MNTFLESSSKTFRDKEEDETTKLLNEKKWEWTILKKKCRNLELEEFYESYMHRIRISHLGLFLFIEAIIVTVHSIILLINVNDHSFIYTDICFYFVSFVLISIILSVNFRENLIKRYTWISYVTSWLAVTILVLSDISLLIMRAITDYNIMRPTYYSFILYSIYIFMPLTENIHAFILGMAVTVSYLLTYAIVTYRQRPDGTQQLDVNKVISEAIFLICVNVLGIFFRMTREVAVRTTFLDRRQCVEENLLLRYARDQEKSLLLSIIPAQIANKIEEDVKLRIENLKVKNKRKRLNQVQVSDTPQVKHWRQPNTEKLFIEPHNDVTILYADVCNYTYLTTTLDVKTLVETIHDLFVKFDTASNEFNVLRIKFLGDCYYCVAGVPIPNEYHARCCVLLGLQMIRDIRDVRNKRQLNIDMRIGIHSGNILSGVIGASKWQFDIWSKDVDIANRLEATGVAGRVHVSEQTLKLLEGEFLYEEGTDNAKNDDMLKKYSIRSFLIKPPTSKALIMLDQRTSFPTTTRKRSIRRSGKSTNFMQSQIVQYNQIRTQARLEMSRELDKMPIGRIQVAKMLFGQSRRLTLDEMEVQSFRSNISTMFLFFKEWRWELMFMNERDIMLKYSIFFAFITFLAAVSMQAVNEPQSRSFWNLTIFSTVVILIILVLTWFKKLWIMFAKDTEKVKPAEESISLFFFNLSDRIQCSVIARITIYLLILVMILTCTLLQLIDCDRFQIENEEIEIQLFQDGAHDDLCFNTWAVTECCVLVICMTFLFTRIPFVLKLTTGVIIIGVYFIIVTLEYDFIYEKSLTTNRMLYPEYSHMLVLLITLVIFHLMDRQTEFISKVDFNWKRQLLKKQDDARFTNETITILVNNILPSHVADIYMSKRMTNELYYEEYDNVAVMFATIRNYDTEQVGMRVLNEIICDFDEVLNTYKGPLKVEKIKVTGWTYMAACGLDPKRSEHVNTLVGTRSSTLLPIGRRSNYKRHSRRSGERTDGVRRSSLLNGTRASKLFLSEYASDMSVRESKESSIDMIRKRNDVVYIMAAFALDLMRTMHSFNMENLQCEVDGRDRGMLRIGISNGPVMAGVVGSYKPHYDIWGNAVNMASRMDSTGLPGHIQVTEETANILQSFDIDCAFRGGTFVKGRGTIPTYFINVSENFEFIEVEDSE